MVTTVKDRLLEYISYKRIEKARFEKDARLSNGFVDKVGDTMRSTSLDKIRETFPDLNLTWLLSGDGSMLKRDFRLDEAKEIDPSVIMIPLISQYAYAGYLRGYSDTEYIETLPKIPVFAERKMNGEYKAFEVRGDSMEDGTMNSICQGDRLISRQIKQDLWQYKLHMNQWNFVIVHKEEGILVKRILNHNIETGSITLHSLNPTYEDFDVNLKDVAQMFNVVEIHRNGRL